MALTGGEGEVISIRVFVFWSTNVFEISCFEVIESVVLKSGKGNHAWGPGISVCVFAISYKNQSRALRFNATGEEVLLNSIVKYYNG